MPIWSVSGIANTKLDVVVAAAPRETVVESVVTRPSSIGMTTFVKRAWRP